MYTCLHELHNCVNYKIYNVFLVCFLFLIKLNFLFFYFTFFFDVLGRQTAMRLPLLPLRGDGARLGESLLYRVETRLVELPLRGYTTYTQLTLP